MRNKYHSYFFPNGRVVFVEWKDIEDAIKQGKELLIVCNAWSGGYAHAIGATKRKGYEMWEPKYVYEMYGYDIKDQTLDATELQKFHKVIFTSGERIYMQSGGQATYHNSGMFMDYDTSFEKFKRSYRYNRETIEEVEKLCSKVDWELTKRHIKDEEKIKCLSSYAPFYTFTERK